MEGNGCTRVTGVYNLKFKRQVNVMKAIPWQLLLRLIAFPLLAPGWNTPVSTFFPALL